MRERVALMPQGGLDQQDGLANMMSQRRDGHLAILVFNSSQDGKMLVIGADQRRRVAPNPALEDTQKLVVAIEVGFQPRVVA